MSFQSQQSLLDRLGVVNTQLMLSPPIQGIGTNFDIFQRRLDAFNTQARRLREEQSDLEFRLQQVPEPEPLIIPDLPIITIEPENNLIRNLLIAGGVLLLI